MDEKQERINALEIMIQNLIVASHKRQYGVQTLSAFIAVRGTPTEGTQMGVWYEKLKSCLGLTNLA